MNVTPEAEAMADKLRKRVVELEWNEGISDRVLRIQYLEAVLNQLEAGRYTVEDAREALEAGAAEHFNNKQTVNDVEAETAAPAFPMEVYPKWVQAYCTEVAEACEVPASVVGFTLLGVLGAAYGTHLQIAFKQGYVRHCHDYFFLVADVSVGKSGVFQYVSKPLYEIQRALRIAQPAPENPKKAPPPPQVIISDCTPEAVVKAQHDNGGAIAMVTPDTPLFSQISATGRNPWPLAPYCSSHTGEPYHVHRITRGPNEIEKARLAIVAGTQPDTLKQVHVRPQIETSGMLSRCTFHVVPKLTAADLSPGDPEVCLERQNKFESAIKKLGLFYRQNPAPPFKLDKEAAAARVQWIDRMRPRYKLPSGDLHQHAGHCAKLEEKIGRWATLLHVLWRSCEGKKPGELTLDDWERGLTLYPFAFEHFKRARDVIYQGPSDTLAGKLKDFCTRYHGERVTYRLIKKNCAAFGRADKGTQDEAVAKLEAEGLVKRIKNANAGGVPSPALEVL